MTIEQARENTNEFIDMLHIQALSRIESNAKDINKTIDKECLNAYLKKRGYTQNTILKKSVMCKGFTVVYNAGTHLEIWHDKASTRSTIITESYLTGLPITLNYMERI